MKDHTDCRRGFHWFTKAWHYGAMGGDPNVTFGMYHKDGGTSGEMSMTWTELGGEMVPQLGVFDDAWSALSLFDDLIQRLGEVDGDNITEEQFIAILKECNFVDLTAYQNPYEDNG